MGDSGFMLMRKDGGEMRSIARSLDQCKSFGIPCYVFFYSQNKYKKGRDAWRTA